MRWSNVCLWKETDPRKFRRSWEVSYSGQILLRNRNLPTSSQWSELRRFRFKRSRSGQCQMSRSFEFPALFPRFKSGGMSILMVRVAIPVHLWQSQVYRSAGSRKNTSIPVGKRRLNISRLDFGDSSSEGSVSWTYPYYRSVSLDTWRSWSSICGGSSINRLRWCHSAIVIESETSYGSSWWNVNCKRFYNQVFPWTNHY